MISETFVEEVVSLLEERLEGETVQIRQILNNNGVCRTGLIIRDSGSHITLCVYLEDFYAEYEEGHGTIRDIVEQIIYVHCQNTYDVSRFYDYSIVRTRLHGRLINTERNSRLLERIPHREFLDLSLVYYVEILCFTDDRLVGSIQIRSEDLLIWGVTENDLYAQVMENMRTSNEVSIVSIDDLWAQITESNQEELSERCFLGYVLSNRQYRNGAVQMLNQKALEEAGKILGSDFYILPSSVNEIILVSVNDFDSIENLVSAVCTVNETDVPECEVLSCHVYQYSMETGQIKIVG